MPKLERVTPAHFVGPFFERFVSSNLALLLNMWVLDLVMRDLPPEFLTLAGVAPPLDLLGCVCMLSVRLNGLLDIGTGCGNWVRSSCMMRRATDFTAFGQTIFAVETLLNASKGNGHQRRHQAAEACHIARRTQSHSVAFATSQQNTEHHRALNPK